MHFRALLFLAALFTALCCGGNSARAGADDFRFLNLTERDGFTASTVRCFLQDRKGFIWMGTELGLLRYDGYRFETFTQRYSDTTSISGNNVLDLAEDRWGRIWISTRADGLSCYYPAKKKFTQFKHDPHNPQTIRTNELKRLHIDARDRLWIGYRHEGWSVMDLRTGAFTHHKAQPLFVDAQGFDRSNSVEPFCEEKDGGMWVTSNYGLHYHAPGGRISTYTSSTGIDPQQDNLFTAVCRGDDSTLWLGTWGAGLKKFNTRTKAFTRYLWTAVNPDAAIHNIVLDIVPKSDTELWLAVADGGLAVFNTASGRFTFMPHNPADPSSPLPDECYSLFKDRSGSLWAGFFSGVSRLPAITSQIRFTPIKNSAPEYRAHIISIEFLEDTASRLLYVGCASGLGLYIIDEARGTERVVPLSGGVGRFGKDVAMHVITILPVGSTHLLLGTSEGMCLYEKVTGKIELLPLKDQHGQPVPGGRLFETASRFWCSSAGTVFSFPKNFTGAHRYDNAQTSALRLPSGQSRVVFAEHDTAVWVTIRQRGLFRMNPAKGTLMQVRGTDNAAFVVGRMVKDAGGAYWFASELHGLFRITLDARGGAHIRQYGLADGLASEILHNLVFDRDGNMIVATQKGPCILPRGGERFISLRRNNLLTAGRPDFSTVYVSPSGRIYQGFKRGLYTWNNRELMSLRTRPPLVLNSVKVFDDELFDTTDVNTVSSIELPHDKNSITLSFTALDYLAPSETKYFSKLDGINEDWIPCGQSLSYSQLAPGRYTLHVKAVTGLGMEAENELKMSIRIRPPFWRTAWFFILCATALGLIAFAVFRYRIATIRKEERMKTAFNKTLAEVEMKALRAQMNPHFLFNCLNSINRYIVVKDTKRASSYLTKFSKLIRLILENSAGDTVSLASETDLLRLYIEMEAMRFEEQFTYDLSIDPSLSLDTVQVPTMIIQPYVENAIWHGLLNKSSDRHLILAFQQLKAGVLEVVIEDNGVGRAQAKALRSKDALKQKSYGMKITNDRIRALNLLQESQATVAVEDLVDERGGARGTRVVLHIPFREAGVHLSSEKLQCYDYCRTR